MKRSQLWQDNKWENNATNDSILINRNIAHSWNAYAIENLIFQQVQRKKPSL